VQRAEDGDRFDGRPGEIGRHVVGDDSEAENANSYLFACRLDGFQVFAGECPEPQFKRQPRSRLFAVSAWVASWLGTAVRIKSERFE
jgi:hypothetical protein